MYIGPWQEMRLAQKLVASKFQLSCEDISSVSPKVKVFPNVKHNLDIKSQDSESLGSINTPHQLPQLYHIESKCSSISSISVESTAKFSLKIDKDCRGFSKSLSRLRFNPKRNVDEGKRIEGRHSKQIKQNRPSKTWFSELPQINSQKSSGFATGELEYVNTSGYNSKELCKVLRTADRPDFSHYWKWKNGRQLYKKEKRSMPPKYSVRQSDFDCSKNTINCINSSGSYQNMNPDSFKTECSENLRRKTLSCELNLSQEDTHCTSKYFYPISSFRTQDGNTTFMESNENLESEHNFLLEWADSLDDSTLTK